jgi:multiple sugar transport system substrate-binding protein
MSDARPPSPDSDEVGYQLLTRRRLLAAGATGLAAAYGLSAVEASARGLSPAARAALEAASGTVTLGSNYSDANPKKAMQAVFDQFMKQNPSINVKVNTVSHNTFQEQINSYLQGQPDDVFTWFAGYRMQFFAQRKLATPIDDVWKTLTPQFSPALKAASTGLDGHQYFVPIYNYPWAVHYQKSLFKENGYTIPKTWDQFIALAKKMKADGVPVGFSDKDGWPAMGTFDYINMRTNGYQFHVDLMAGKKSWDSPQVKATFNHWRELMELYQPGALGRTWQETGTDLQNKKTGMLLLGTFVGTVYTDKAAHNELDFFAFPSINPKWGQDSVEAPIDGFMLSKSPKNPEAAKALLTFLGSAAAANTYLKYDPNNVGTNKKTNTKNYTPLQKKSAKLIASAKHISQFLDRDTRPDFASTVMIPALQQFIRTPNAVNSLVKSIERQKKAIFGA